jgi:heme-degrading monooxygenase HmoA
VIRVNLQIQVRPGRGAAFEETWRRIAEAVAQTPGNVRQTLLRCALPNTYLITSDWLSLASFQSFERSHDQDQLTAPLRELRISSEMSIQEVVENVDPPEGSM